MSRDEEWVRGKWNGFVKWLRTPSCKRVIACASNETLVEPTTTTSANGNKTTELDAYAKGYQDGWKAGLAIRSDFAVASNSTKPSNVPSSGTGTDRSTESVSLMTREIEQRAMRAGWNRAWEVARQEGWTKGCAHCSLHARHQHVLSRGRGATVSNESSTLPNIDPNVLARSRGMTIGFDSLAASNPAPNVVPRRRGSMAGPKSLAGASSQSNVLPQRRPTTASGGSYGIVNDSPYAGARSIWKPYSPPSNSADSANRR